MVLVKMRVNLCVSVFFSLTILECLFVEVSLSDRVFHSVSLCEYLSMSVWYIWRDFQRATHKEQNITQESLARVSRCDDNNKL